MTCDFRSLSTVFQSYQDDGGMIMKDCVLQGNPIYGWEDFSSSGSGGLEPGTARSVGCRA